MKGFGPKRTALFLLAILSTASAFSLPAEYEQSNRPNVFGVADVVNVSIHILAIRNINENSQEITLDFFLRTYWVDPRLAGLVERETVFVNKIPDIWLPDLFIVNSVSSHNPEKHSHSLSLKGDGSVAHSERLSAKISCPMSFVKFPFDKQTCRIDFNSYGYTTVHLFLTWHGMANEDISIYDPEYKLSGTEQSSETVKTKTGEYLNLVLEVSIYRCGFRYLRRAIIPAFFFGLLSYLTFYMKIKNKRSPEESEQIDNFKISSTVGLLRIAINGFMLFLVAFIAQMNFLNAPDSSAITALDVWMGLVATATFLAFAQSIYIFFVQWQRSLIHQKEDSEELSDKIDRICTLTYPILFVLFAVIYFAVYLS